MCVCVCVCVCISHMSPLEGLTLSPCEGLGVCHLFLTQARLRTTMAASYPLASTPIPVHPPHTQTQCAYTERPRWFSSSPGWFEQWTTIDFSNRCRRPRWRRWKSTRPGNTIDRQLPGPLCSTSSWMTSAGSTRCTSFLSRWLTPGIFWIVIIQQCNTASAALHEGLSMCFISCGSSLRSSPGEQLHCLTVLVSLIGSFMTHWLCG